MNEKTAHGNTAVCCLLSAVSQYLEMIYDGDLNRFDAVFAPSAQLHGVQEGQVRVLPVAEYRRLLSSRPSPKSKNAPRQQEILLIDIASSSQPLRREPRLRLHRSEIGLHADWVHRSAQQAVRRDAASAGHPCSDDEGSG